MNATVTPSLLPFSAGSVRISAKAATAITALNGIRCWLTRLQIRHPGTAPSRLNAYIIREALVMQLMPQNSWPMTAMMRTNFTQPAAHRALEHGEHGAAALGDRVDVGGGEGDRQQYDVADQR